MRLILAPILAILALVTLASGAHIPPAARTKLATSGSEDSSKVARGIFSDDSDFTGTPEEIYQKVKARRDSLGLFNRTNLEARDPIYPVLCVPIAGWFWGKANVVNADFCYGVLMATGGRIWVPPQSCVRICCKEGDEVFLCNDNTYAIDPALNYIATYIPDIVEECEDQYSPGLAGGQMFDSDRYDVILRGNGGPFSSC